LVLASAAASADDRVENLPKQDRAWLEEEVVYIITNLERDVFLDLKSQEERDLFIKAFWDRRDPNPATLENEFMTEHYRRLEYAIRTLGRDSTRPGWRTDRGRYYIILGEPAEIQRYDGSNEVVTIELWIYSGDTKAGLPPRFNLLFFKDNDIGEYRLYHPFGDGPHSLLHDGFSLRTNQNQALDLLETISVDLAKASLTVDLTEPTADMFFARNTRDPLMDQVRPSLTVDRNLAEIEEYATKKVNTNYLDGYLKFGNRVSADYSFNYIANRATFAVLEGPGGTSFIHYSIEVAPEHLTLERNDEGTAFYTTLQVGLELRNREGQLLAVTENLPFLELTASQFEQAKAYPFAYRDSFPVLPGEYQVNVVLRNRASKQYTVAEAAVTAPTPSTAPGLTELVLASKVDERLDTPEDAHKTYQLGWFEIDPVVEDAFTVGSTIHAVTQVRNPTSESRVRFSLHSGEAVLYAEEKDVVEGETRAVAAALSIVGVEPGPLGLLVELLDGSGAVQDSRTREITVSPRTSIPRAGFVYRRSFGTDSPGLLDMTLGEQLMARGRIDEAEERLRRAVEAANPQLTMAKWKLASALLFKREADEALSLLLPLEKEYANQVEVVEGLGFSYYIKEDFSRAAPFLEQAKALRPPDTSLLNALGDCYQRLSDPLKARENFERSLELNPQQDGVKARLKMLSGA
jgi:GWxTD domain-containing protein